MANIKLHKSNTDDYTPGGHRTSADEGATWSAESTNDYDLELLAQPIAGKSDFEIISQVNWSNEINEENINRNISYITKFFNEADQCNIATESTDKGLQFDSSASTHIEHTADWNNPLVTSFDTIDTGDYLLFSKTNCKFSGVAIILDNFGVATPDAITVEYFNGTNFTPVPKSTFNFNNNSGMIWFEIPNDWVKEDIDVIESIAIDAVDRFWIKVSFDKVVDVQKVKHNWIVIWDSEESNVGTFRKYIPIEFEVSGDFLLACLLTTDEGDVASNKGQYLLGELDISTDCPDFVFAIGLDDNLQYGNFNVISGDWHFTGIDRSKAKEVLLFKSIVGNIQTGGGAKPDEIKRFKSGETDIRTIHESDGILYGVTGNEYNSLFQYANEFKPIIQQAAFRSTLKQALEKCLQLTNKLFVIRNTRILS